jgi:hypothetical protein
MSEIPATMRTSLNSAQVVRPWDEITFPEFRKQAREAARVAGNMTLFPHNNDTTPNAVRVPKVGFIDSPSMNDNGNGYRGYNQQERFRGLDRPGFRGQPEGFRGNQSEGFRGGQMDQNRARSVMHRAPETFNGQSNQMQNRGDRFNGKCDNCGIFGHQRRDCRIPEDKIRKFIDAEKTGIAVVEYEDMAVLEREQQGCFYCKETGHIARNCMKNPKRAVVVQDLKDEVLYQMQPLYKQIEELKNQLTRLNQPVNATTPRQPNAAINEQEERRLRINMIKEEIARLEGPVGTNNQSGN